MSHQVGKSLPQGGRSSDTHVAGKLSSFTFNNIVKLQVWSGFVMFKTKKETSN